MGHSHYIRHLNTSIQNFGLALAVCCCSTHLLPKNTCLLKITYHTFRNITGTTAFQKEYKLHHRFGLANIIHKIHRMTHILSRK